MVLSASQLQLVAVMVANSSQFFFCPDKIYVLVNNLIKQTNGLISVLGDLYKIKSSDARLSNPFKCYPHTLYVAHIFIRI